MEVWYTRFRRSHNALLSSFMWHKLLKLIFECRTNYTFFVFVAFILYIHLKNHLDSKHFNYGMPADGNIIIDKN